MKILAIRLARLGDVILLTPALSALKAAFPGAHLTLLTGHRCAPLAELSPQIDDVIAVDRLAMRDGPKWRALAAMAGLVRQVRGRRFDLAVDFHSFRETNLLTWLSGAPVRVGLQRRHAPYLKFCFNRPPVLEDKRLHVGAMFQKVVESVGPGPAAPGRTLEIPEHLRRWAEQAAPEAPRVVLYVDAPVAARVWPPERFAAAADFAKELGAGVVVIAGPQGAKLAREVRQASRKPGPLAVFTDVTIPQLAALVASARLLVSNDTGPMHLGPALGTPTLGLFSIGYPEHFRPTGPGDRYLRADPIWNIPVQAVTRAMEEMWSAGVRPGSTRG